MTLAEALVLPTLAPKTYGKPLSSATRVMVMLAGWPDTHDMWTPVIQKFEDSFHMISITTPDYDQTELRKAWGYSFHEALQMIEACIDAALGPERSFDLVIHDWGSLWGFMYANKHGSRVSSIVAFDVGAPISPDMREQPQGAFWTLPYQLLLATVFWIGHRIHGGLAQCIMQFFMRSWLSPAIGPMGFAFRFEKHMPRPLTEVKWWMCWPYFHIWFRVILAGKIKEMPKFVCPSDKPIFFGWGKQKRAFFHTKSFLEKIQSSQGCKAVEYDTAHWVMFEEPDKVTSDMKSFLKV